MGMSYHDLVNARFAARTISQLCADFPPYSYHAIPNLLHVRLLKKDCNFGCCCIYCWNALNASNWLAILAPHHWWAVLHSPKLIWSSSLIFYSGHWASPWRPHVHSVSHQLVFCVLDSDIWLWTLDPRTWNTSWKNIPQGSKVAPLKVWKAIVTLYSAVWQHIVSYHVSDNFIQE